MTTSELGHEPAQAAGRHGTWGVRFKRLVRTGTLGPTIVLVVLLVLNAIIQPSSISSYGLMTTVNGAAAVAIASAGLALIVLVGGLDLSVGSALSLVNVVIAVSVGRSTGSQALMIFVGLGVGVVVGLVNGLLTVALKIPSIVGTLAMSFFWGGIALLILKQPGGSVPDDFVNWFTGTIGGVVPASLVLILVIIAAWMLLKRTRFGAAIYVVGADSSSAQNAGVRSGLVTIGAFVLGGLLYGLAGVFLTAQSASGDPNVGSPLLLTAFAAVVIGGTTFGGGKGDVVGGVIGAFVLYLIANVLFALGVSSFYSSIFNGVVLLIAVVATSDVGLTKLREFRSRRAEASLKKRGMSPSPMQSEGD